jgi:hypothetical protein
MLYQHRWLVAIVAPALFIVSLAKAQGVHASANGTKAVAKSETSQKVAAGETPHPRTRVDFSGLWFALLNYGNGKQVVQYSRMETKGNELLWCTLPAVTECSRELTIENICSPPGGGPACVENSTWAGSLGDDSKIDITAQFDVKDHPDWKHDTLLIDDPDRMHTASGFKLFRLVPRAKDVACDAQNSSRTTGEYAFVRAKEALYGNDTAQVPCWLHTAAAQGDARSQSLYASVLYSGEWVHVDYPGAFYWAKKGAEQNEFFGEFMLALMYQKGKGVQADTRKSNEWLAKAREGYKVKLREMHVSPGFAGMSPEQQGVAMRATLAVFNIFRGAGAQDAAVMAERIRNPGQSLSGAEQAAERDPNVRVGQQQVGSGLDTILGMILGTDEQYNEAVRQAH